MRRLRARYSGVRWSDYLVIVRSSFRRWKVSVRLPDETALPAGGEYLTVDIRNRVTLTRRYELDPPTLGRQVTKVTYRFDPIEGGRGSPCAKREFGSSAAAREHADGWKRTLDLLHAYLAYGDRGQPFATHSVAV